jgi:hypothetical protein
MKLETLPLFRRQASNILASLHCTAGGIARAVPARMRRLLVFALVLLPALPALAGGRTFAVTTLATRGTLKLKSGESSVTVKSKIGLKLSFSTTGTTGSYLLLSAAKNAAGTDYLYRGAGKGYYYASSPIGEGFQIK